MNNTPEIGKIVKDTNAQRDAIHFAVAPCVAGHTLAPGAWVQLKDGQAINAMSWYSVGIVDPFLTAPVKAGERFWLMLKPNTVTSLRHDWTHPQFAPSVRVDPPHPDEERLLDIARCYGLGRQEVLFTPPSEWCKNTDDDLPWEFWNLYQEVTGKTVSEDDRWVRCAC